MNIEEIEKRAHLIIDEWSLAVQHDDIQQAEYCRGALSEIFYTMKAAQHSAHPTLLSARHKLVSCPQCKLMFGVDLPASQSG